MAETTFDLQMGKDGEVHLPHELQQALGVQAGDVLTLIQTGAGLVFIPKRLTVTEIAAYFERLMAQEGITLVDVLADLDEEGEKLFKERYGHLISS